MTRELSVFFPCINEEGNVEKIVRKAQRFLEELKLKYEIIIVDDGSKDKTGEIADNLAKNDSHIRVIHHPKNLGYGEALKSGFYNAKYDTIVYTDGDGQFDFAEVTKFLEKIEDNDLIIGYRIKRRDPFFRILFKEGWKLSLLLFFRLTLRDVDCGFKMIRKAVLEKIPHLESGRGAMINAEVAIKAKKFGFKIAEVGVNHYPRVSGKPTGASLNVIIKSYLDLVRMWWGLKQNKGAFIMLLAILTLASFLRFYKLDEYMIFLGDEGRDAIIVKNMWVERHFPLIGPPTSVGNIYLGPLYYYMMFVPMALTGFNPVSATVMVALIGVLTVVFVYYLGKVWFGKTAGLIASFLYAISPVTINYSKFSWNPNPLPLFALIAIFGLYRLHKGGNFNWLIFTGASLAAALQMHYLALILIPVSAFLYVFEVVKRVRAKMGMKNLISGTVFGIITFLIIMSPLVWFDLRHNFLNYRAITTLFTEDGTLKSDLVTNVSKIPAIYTNNLIGRYMAGENLYTSILLGIVIISALVFKGWPRLALGVWLVIGLFGISFYQQNIYDHYLGFLNPVPFLLLGSLFEVKFINKDIKNGFRVGLLILIVSLTFLNLQKSPLNYPPNNQLQRTQDVAKFIIEKSGNQDFNFALLAKSNYDSAYQFLLDQYSHKPKQVPIDITKQLFVVCEDLPCEPTHSAKYEVAGFGWSKIEWTEDVYGVRVYKLVHNPSGKP